MGRPLALVLLTFAVPLAAPWATAADDLLSPTALYTPEQAARGKVLYESTCGQCHQFNLRGRTGGPGETPALTRLPDSYVQMIDENDGKVPPLIGAEWASRWGVKPASEYVTRVDEAIKGFPPAGANEATAVELVAYFLQAMGARPGKQPLTAQTPAIINTAIRAQAPVATR